MTVERHVHAFDAGIGMRHGGSGFGGSGLAQLPKAAGGPPSPSQLLTLESFGTAVLAVRVDQIVLPARFHQRQRHAILRPLGPGQARLDRAQIEPQTFW